MALALEGLIRREYPGDFLQFIEMYSFAKPVLAEGDSANANEVRATAAHVLGVILRLLHPVMPYVTEDLWAQFGYGERHSLIRADWPLACAVTDAPAARAELDWVVRLITEVRTVRAEMNVPPSIRTPILLRDAGAETLARGERWFDAIGRLARASALSPLTGDMPRGAVQVVMDEATLVLPLADVVDLAAERARLDKERGKAMVEAGKVAQKLANADFIARAPEDVVEENRARLQAAQDEISRLEAALQRIA